MELRGRKRQYIEDDSDAGMLSYRANCGTSALVARLQATGAMVTTHRPRLLMATNLRLLPSTHRNKHPPVVQPRRRRR